ncbi:hypothetical protein BGW38_008943 [Lunasporangiospora selenospora]|uniref:WD domain-containing protein, G-beta repeat-containing protein n=1 Tax=Lunasporangiospora selenospora TaxID=979761 RepID=A0A9P6KGA8_9FUNG|nr:hypothetical protein BGW38_008943 [Lunasporangiospora selenospora]
MQDGRVSDSTINIYQFATLTPSGPPALVDRLVDPRRTNAELHSKTINVIKVGYLGTDEVLVAADEKGEVCVWFTMNLSRDPLLLSVTKSAWGIDIHASRRLIAISSNAYTATVFYCGTEARPSEQRTFRDTDETSQVQRSTEPESHLNIPSYLPASSSTSSSSVHGFPLERLLQILQQEDRNLQQARDRDASRVESASEQILRGHKHNIPSVCFSPCGHFVATASIDQTCRTWRLSDGMQVQQRCHVPLWGWGVVFIPKDAWLKIQRSDYKMIPKSHLQPGKLPGQNVRDSPLWTATNPPRRFPFGRDQRMVRTRWFAGPLHGTSCDEADTEDELDENDDDADGQMQYSNIGQGISGHGHGGVNLRHSRRAGGEFYDDDDDRDAALFGMDDDEGEEGEDSGDEWEEYLSGSEESDLAEVEETEDRHHQQGVSNCHRKDFWHGTEFAVDTGDDGDDEQVGGMETEDGGGTTEDGRGSQSNSQLLRKPVSITETEVSEIGESSEYEQSSQRPDVALPSSSSNSHHALGQPPHPEQGQCPDGHDPAISTSTYPSESVQEQEQSEQLMTKQQLWNKDPKKFIQFSRTDQHLNAVTESPAHPSSNAPTPTLPSLAQHSSAPLPFPTELLAYATARNIYLLGPHYMPVKAPNPAAQTTTMGRTNERMGTNTASGDTESDGMSGEHPAPMSSGLPVHFVYGESGEDEEYESEDVDDRGVFRTVASTLTEQIEHNYGQEYDTDMEYDDMDYFMDETEAESEDDDQAQEGQHMDEENEEWEDESSSTENGDHHNDHDDEEDAEDDDDDDDNDDDDDDDDMDLSIDSEGTPGSEQQRLNRIGETLRTFAFRGLDIAPLHYISVARAAVDRADGRRSRHLEHCDRLFVMRVTDDSEPVEDGQEVHGDAHGSAPLGSQHGESGKSEKTDLSFKKGVESSSMANPTSGGSSSSRRLSDSRQDPGSQPSNLPGKRAPSTKEVAAEIMMKEGEHYVLFPEVYLPRHDLRPMPLLGVSAVAVQNYHRPEAGEGGAEGSTVSPIRASSFVLHLAYLDGQLFSYEIQLRGDKRDPVPAFNLFV